MEIIEYSDKWKEKWDQFVLESNNGTIFHTQKFFDYHTEGKFNFNHLLFIEKNTIVALLPGSRIGNFYESPIGASYGSIVTKDAKFSNAMEMVSTLMSGFFIVFLMFLLTVCWNLDKISSSVFNLIALEI